MCNSHFITYFFVNVRKHIFSESICSVSLCVCLSALIYIPHVPDTSLSLLVSMLSPAAKRTFTLQLFTFVSLSSPLCLWQRFLDSAVSLFFTSFFFFLKRLFISSAFQTMPFTGLRSLFAQALCIYKARWQVQV